jgi:hypothetical protein
MPRALTSREKYLAAFATLTALLYAGVEGVFLPLVHRNHRVELELAQAQAEYAHARRLEAAAETATNSAIAKIGADTEHTALADFLREAEAAAGPHVLIRRFQPQHQRTPRSNRKAEMVGMTSLSVQLECSGALPDLLEFFARLESKDELTRIRHFYLTPERNGGERLQCQLVVMRMRG